MKTIMTALILGLMVNQSSFEANTSKSEFLIKGTSTVHDWESVINEYSVKGNLGEDQVTNLEVVVVAGSIKSGKSIMDDKTYDALQVKKFPNIEFKASQLERSSGKITGKGTLTLVGNTKEVSFSADATETSGGALKVKGAVKLVMSEFGIEPPTAMFGTLTTGDEVTIDFNFLLN